VDACHDFLEPVVERLAVPRRIADAVRRIVAILPRLAAGGASKFSRTPLYPLAKQLLEGLAASAVTVQDEVPPEVGAADGAQLDGTSARSTRRKKKRSRKRRSSSRSLEGASETAEHSSSEAQPDE
jgi:hypothetical protein